MISRDAFETYYDTAVKRRFRIEYKDPVTQELVVVEHEFANSETISAREWAEDWAYCIADKGHHVVSEFK